ncbi:MAG TPA: 3-hydroxy-3-methylglutaryl-CoA reductase, partial [Chloroflexi bacterium]|nr:3-hydroxy-3-methylglutaryl-CoA reductase [Chloroflexota bacterium]
MTSRLPGFYNHTLNERWDALARSGLLTPEEIAALKGDPGLPLEQADHMVENVVGRFALPLGLGLNFIINGREIIIPMAVEEPSIVAGASFMAKLARPTGGFFAQADPPVMIGQMQVLGLADPHSARLRLLEHKAELLAEAAEIDPILQDLGGGPRDLQVRLIADSPIGPFLAAHLLYDVRDAMGANAV